MINKVNNLFNTANYKYITSKINTLKYMIVMLHSQNITI